MVAPWAGGGVGVCRGVGCGRLRALETTAQAGKRGALASLQEGAAGSFPSVTPTCDPSSYHPSLEKAGPTGP